MIKQYDQSIAKVGVLVVEIRILTCFYYRLLILEFQMIHSKKTLSENCILKIKLVTLVFKI
jgi:hypothetical protein